MLISIETYRIFDFPGGPGPHTPLDPRMRIHLRYPNFQVNSKANPEIGFFHAIVHFPFPEHLVTPQNMMRYMILQYVSGKQILRPRTLVRVETQ